MITLNVASFVSELGGVMEVSSLLSGGFYSSPCHDVNRIKYVCHHQIKAQAETANMIQGVISYALLDRSQENG